VIHLPVILSEHAIDRFQQRIAAGVSRDAAEDLLAFLLERASLCRREEGGKTVWRLPIFSALVIVAPCHGSQTLHVARTVIVEPCNATPAAKVGRQPIARSPATMRLRDLHTREERALMRRGLRRMAS
jgi:hypothetical protein